MKLKKEIESIKMDIETLFNLSKYDSIRLDMGFNLIGDSKNFLKKLKIKNKQLESKISKLKKESDTLPNMSDYVKEDISVELNNCKLKSLENYINALENLVHSLRSQIIDLENKGK